MGVLMELGVADPVPPSMLNRFLSSCGHPSGLLRRLVRKRCLALNGLPSPVPSSGMPPPAGDGFDRSAHGFSIADKLIQITCTTWYLGDRPITDCRAERREIHLPEELAEG